MLTWSTSVKITDQLMINAKRNSGCKKNKRNLLCFLLSICLSLISSYPEDQFENHLLLRYLFYISLSANIFHCSDILAAFIIRGRRLGRSVTLKKIENNFKKLWKAIDVSKGCEKLQKKNFENPPFQPLDGKSLESSASCEQTTQKVAPAAVTAPANGLKLN